MSDIDLDAIEARANAATPGPWHVVEIDPDGRWGIQPDNGDSSNNGPTARFVAHARTDVPALIARVREQEQEIARLTQDARRWRWARAGLFVTPHPDGEPVVSYQSGSMDEVAAKLYASLPKTPRGIVRDVTPVFDAAIAEKARA